MSAVDGPKPQDIVVGNVKMIKLEKIDDMIASDSWSYNHDGTNLTSLIEIGRPFQDSEGNHDWICPVSIEHYTEGVRCIYGVGPVDSLMNAMTLVKMFFDKHKAELTSIGGKEAKA